MSSNLSSAQITMNFQDFDEIRQQIPRLQKQIAELTTTQPPAVGIDDDLAAAITAAIPLVQFAVASLDPRTVRGWPHEELVEFSAALLRAYPNDQQFVDLDQTLNIFATECIKLEKFRAQRSDNMVKILLTPPPDAGPPNTIAAAAALEPIPGSASGMTGQGNGEAPDTA